MANDDNNTGHFNSIYSVLLGVISLLLLIFWFIRTPKNYPPSYGGWFPWIGCAIEFGKAPLHYIQNARDKLGPLFTLKVAGKRLTFITDPDDFKHFFASSNVDFQLAVQQPVEKTASVTSESFFKYHTKIHDTVKGRLAPAYLEPFCTKLKTKFVEQLDHWGDSGKGDLNCLVRSAMYVTVLDNLFGENILPTKSREHFKELEQNFVTYDDLFEYGSQLPESFLKSWSASKWWLLKKFRSVVSSKEENKHNENTVFDTLIELVDRPHAPNYGLLLMWASLANAIPITFWTLAFVLSNDKIVQEIRKEIQDVLGTYDATASISQEDLQRIPSVKRAVLEAIRLRSPGVITRGVAKTFQCRGYTVPAGDHLMLSPYWAHRNTKYFPDPEAFKPDRWKAADLEKNSFLEGFVAFGGGRYQCPGRWFGLLEIHLFVVLILWKYDIEMLQDIPTNSPLHLVGTQQPVTGLEVKYQLLSSAST